MIPLFLLKLVGGRKLIAWIVLAMVAAAVVGAIGWAGGKVVGWKRDAAELAVVKPQLEAFKAGQAKANAKVEKQAPVDEAERVKLAAEKAAIEAERARVDRAWARVNAVKESTDETGNPVVRLSDDWGLCFSAAAAGDPADLAACSSGGGDGPVTPGPGGGSL